MNDGIVIWRSKRRERAEATVTRLRPISPRLFLLTVAVIMAVALPLTIWQYGIAGHDPAQRFEAIKIGLNVATLIGGASALLLAFRRQRSTEIIAAETQETRDKEYEQRDRAADASERVAEQRRITAPAVRSSSTKRNLPAARPISPRRSSPAARSISRA